MRFPTVVTDDRQKIRKGCLTGRHSGFALYREFRVYRSRFHCGRTPEQHLPRRCEMAKGRVGNNE